MVSRSVPVLLLAALCLIGCRDSLVDEPLDTAESPETEETGARPIYLKGPETIILGDSREFRVEPIQEATRYSWEIHDSSSGRLSGHLEADNEGRDRIFLAEATRTGYVYLRVSVFDDTSLIGVARKAVRIDR